MSDLYFAGREAALESQLKNEQVASDHLNAKLIAAQQRLAEVERLIPREVKLKLASDGDSVAETVYKLVSDWELTHTLYKQTYDERDALRRELDEIRAKGFQEVEHLKRENQRLRELAEKALDHISVDDVAWARQALHHAARTGEGQDER